MPYTIGQLAKANSLTLRALRYYDARGLVSPKRIGDGPHAQREYSENDALRLAEVIRGQAFGLTLKEIGEFLEEGPTGPWLHIPPERARELADDLGGRIKHAQASIGELRKIAAESPVGAISASGATTAPPEGEKRAPSSPR